LVTCMGTGMDRNGFDVAQCAQYMRFQEVGASVNMLSFSNLAWRKERTSRRPRRL
jgi:hypothetical protein